MEKQGAIMKYKTKSGNEVELSFELIKRYLVHGKAEFVTAQEMMLFMGICKERGLNPFAKDCYLIKYTKDDPAAIVTSVDYFRSRAKAQPDCKGWSSGTIVKTKEGEIKRTNGLVLEGETLVGGWFKAHIAGWDEPVEWDVPLKSFIKKTREGKVTRFWQEENQPFMIAKVAETQGLKKYWPDEFAKLYSPEEMGHTIDFQAPDIEGQLEEMTTGGVAEFDKLVNDKLEGDADKIKAIEKFIAETAKANDVTVDECKGAAYENFDEFWAAFEGWLKKKTKKTEKSKKPPAEEKTDRKLQDPAPEKKYSSILVWNDSMQLALDALGPKKYAEVLDAQGIDADKFLQEGTPSPEEIKEIEKALAQAIAEMPVAGSPAEQGSFSI